MSEHGTTTAYVRGCRCDLCRVAWAVKYRALRAERRAALSGANRPERNGHRAKDATNVIHGTASTYRNWGCRCRPCTDAHAVKHREEMARSLQRRGILAFRGDVLQLPTAALGAADPEAV